MKRKAPGAPCSCQAALAPPPVSAAPASFAWQKNPPSHYEPSTVAFISITVWARGWGGGVLVPPQPSTLPLERQALSHP